MKKTFFRIHFTFFLLLLLGYFTQTIFQILMVYACLTVHELAHVVAARARGIGIQYISVMPFGIAIRLRQDRIRGTADQLLCVAVRPTGKLFVCGRALRVTLLYSGQHLPLFTQCEPVTRAFQPAARPVAGWGTGKLPIAFAGIWQYNRV